MTLLFDNLAVAFPVITDNLPSSTMTLQSKQTAHSCVSAGLCYLAIC